MYDIKTNIPSEFFEIIESIQGQLSDGIWENSPSMNKYWMGIEIVPGTDGFVHFKLDNYYWYYNFGTLSKMYGKFLKLICMEYLKDYRKNENVKPYFTNYGRLKSNWFSKKNKVVIEYLQRYMYFDIILQDGTVCHEKKMKDIFKVSDCIKIYELLVS